MLTDLFPASRYTRIGEVDFPGQMTELGYTPNNSTDRTKPDGIGNVAAQAVLDYRHNDNSNQLNGYADTTGYQPVNTWNQINDPWRWQPLCVLTPAGVTAKAPHLPPPGQDCVAPHYTKQGSYTPQFKNVLQFAPFTYQIPGPKKLPNGQYDPSDVDTAPAGDLQPHRPREGHGRVLGGRAEHRVPARPHLRVRPGPLPQAGPHPGHRRQDVLRARQRADGRWHRRSWNAKYKWDFVRPITAIRARYAGQKVTSWLGPYQGYGKVEGSSGCPTRRPTW